MALAVGLGGTASAAVRTVQRDVTVVRQGGVVWNYSDVVEVGDDVQIAWSVSSSDPTTVALAELEAPQVLPGTQPGLFATTEEVVELLRPRWHAGWRFGLDGEPDHRALVESRADRLEPGTHYDAPYDDFTSSDFRRFAKAVGARAFRALMEDDAADREVAIAALVAQARAPGSDWSTWPRGDRDSTSGSSSRAQFANAHAMAALADAHSMLRHHMSPADRLLVERWLNAWGHLVLEERRGRMTGMVENWETARDPATYRWKGTWDVPLAEAGLTEYAWLGSPRLYYSHYQYNNRWASMMRAMTMVGVVTRDGELKERGEQFFKEALAFGWFPEGFNVDFHRGDDDGSIAYAALVLGNMVTIADVLLRDGHANLYEYATTAGVLGSEGAFPGATAKRLDGAIREMGKHYDGTYQRPALEAPDVAMGSYTRGDQFRGLLANVYYRDPELARRAGLRCTGAACPTIGKAVLGDAWTLDKEAGPSLFLLAVDRLDGTPWPYPTL